MHNLHRNHKAYWDEEKGGEREGGMKVGEGGDCTDLSLHCHHKNGEGHFNVSLIVRDKMSQDSVHNPQLF